MDRILDAMSEILTTLSEGERKAWDGQSQEMIGERLRVMAAWIIRRRTDHNQRFIDAGFSSPSVLAAYRATVDLVIILGYKPSCEKKWSAKGEPTISLKYRDGSDFDWAR